MKRYKVKGIARCWVPKEPVPEGDINGAFWETRGGVTYCQRKGEKENRRGECKMSGYDPIRTLSFEKKGNLHRGLG